MRSGFGGRRGISTERQASFWYPGGLVAVHSEGRSREALWAALKRREVYGTSGPRILLWFDLLSENTERRPMGSELAYVASKGALHQLTESLSDVLVEQGITVNTVNPGPTDTGWVSEGFRPELLARSPFGRIGEPDDAARLVAWLVSDAGRWVTGQVIDSEGGFRRR